MTTGRLPILSVHSSGAPGHLTRCAGLGPSGRRTQESPMKIPRVCRTQGRRPAGAVDHRPSRAGPARRGDRHPLLRRLPLRHPPGPRRVGRARCSRWCPATRSSAASPRSGTEVDQPSSVGRPRRRRLHGRLLSASARPAVAGQEQFCEKGAAFTYNSHRDGPEDADLRRLLDADRGRRALRAQGPRRGSTRPAPRRCSARASRPTRRCASGR